MSAPGGVLGRILARTREQVLVRRRERPLEKLLSEAPTLGKQRPFGEAVARPGRVNVIAEFKRRSPSRGVIREDLHPVQVAQAYEIAGAAALSVLTEEQFFGGSLEDLREARAATLLPTLRKDFIVDPYQVWEARQAGADAVLLIVGAVTDRELAELWSSVREAELEALFEVHDKEEMARALGAGARIVGVNNRDLRTMKVRLETSFNLAPLIPEDVVAVSESGIRGGDDVRLLHEAGFDAVLVGEQLMQAPEPGTALEALIREVSGAGAFGRRSSRGARTLVKVCGITTVEDGLLAARLGADAVGFVLWPGSPRFLDVEKARRLSGALPPFLLRVGVFVDAPREELVRAAEEVGLDLLQLHGDEAPEDLVGLPRRVVKSVRVGAGFKPEDALRYEGQAAGILLDTREETAPGGTGRTFDWSLARAVRDRAAFLALAGGLTPENVVTALETVRPDAVDVSSGVESAPGRKDPEKIRAFFDAVRSFDRRMAEGS